MVFQLYSWGASFELASIDPVCLTVQTYLNLVKADWEVDECNNPNLSPSGELPLLRDGAEHFFGVNNIINYLSKQGLDLNQGLSDRQKAECFAYSALVNDKLQDALLYSWYGDQENFTKVIRPTFSKLLPLTLRYYTPILLKNSALSRIGGYGLTKEEGRRNKENQRDIIPEIYQIARESYRVLSQKLGEQNFFMGDKPSALDTIIFGQLALHYYPQLPNMRLASMIKEEFPNLSDFCDRVRSMAFIVPARKVDIPDTSSSMGSIIGTYVSWLKTMTKFVSGKENEIKSPDQIEFERKRFLSIFGASWFMLAFVVYNGVISIEVTNPQKKRYHEELKAKLVD